MNKNMGNIKIELKKEELEYINSFLFSHSCEIDLLPEKQKRKKPVSDYVKIIKSIEKKISV